MSIKFVEAVTADGEPMSMFVAYDECLECKDREDCLHKYRSAYFTDLAIAYVTGETESFKAMLEEMKSGGVCLREI